jgi:hypothetical protein
VKVELTLINRAASSSNRKEWRMERTGERAETSSSRAAEERLKERKRRLMGEADDELRVDGLAVSTSRLDGDLLERTGRVESLMTAELNAILRLLRTKEMTNDSWMMKDEGRHSEDEGGWYDLISR